MTKEGKSFKNTMSQTESNNEEVAALSKELEDWKNKYENLQNISKSKCLELQRNFEKIQADSKKDLQEKNQEFIDLEKEKDNLMKSLEEKQGQVCNAMEQVKEIYEKYEESKKRVEELEKRSIGSMDIAEPGPKDIKKEVGIEIEDRQMVRTKKELDETKKKLRQLEVQSIILLKSSNLLLFKGKYIHKRAMLELKEKEVTQLRRENRRLEVEMGTGNGSGIVTVEVSP